MTKEDILREADEAARRFAMQIASQDRGKAKPKPPEIETSEVLLKNLPISFGLKRNI